MNLNLVGVESVALRPIRKKKYVKVVLTTLITTISSEKNRQSGRNHTSTKKQYKKETIEIASLYGSFI